MYNCHVQIIDKYVEYVKFSYPYVSLTCIISYKIGA